VARWPRPRATVHFRPAGAYNVADDEPASADAWVPAFCAAVGAPAPGESGMQAHAWARGVTNALARRQGWVPSYPAWTVGFTTGM
jgi:hypothetical protein